MFGAEIGQALLRRHEAYVRRHEVSSLAASAQQILKSIPELFCKRQQP